MKTFLNLVLVFSVIFLYSYFEKNEKYLKKPIKENAHVISESKTQQKNTTSRIIANASSEESKIETTFDEKNVITHLAKQNFKKELFFCKAKISDCEFFPNANDHAGRGHKLKFCYYFAHSLLKEKDPKSYCENLHYKDPIIQSIKKAYAETYKNEQRSCFTLSNYCSEEDHKYPISDSEAEQLSILEFNATIKYIF